MSSGTIRVGVVVALLLTPGLRPHAQPARPALRPELLVKFRSGASPSQRQAALARVGARLQARFDSVDVDHLALPPGLDAQVVARMLQGDPSVLHVQPNYERRIVVTPNDPAWANDSLWGLKRVNASAAWTAFPPQARDVLVAVIDTGVNYRHADLAANIWTNPGEVAGNGLDDDGNGYVDDVHGIDTLNRDADPLDDNGHGTHTAGILGAEGNNGIGATGVAWSPRILACKALDSAGNGTDAAAIACFDYLIDLKVRRGVNVRISNNSWGSVRDLSGPFPHVLKDAVDATGQAGILNVFAAGNTNTNVESAPFDPASFSSPSIVSVAASDEADARAPFSNFGGTSIDLAAPGVNIFSTYRDGYAYSNGTSMAAPYVSGTLALMAAQNPSLAVDGLKTRLLASVDPLPQWAGLNATGGRLNVFQAVMAATESAPPTALSASGWQHRDIGDAGAIGDASMANGTFSVTGAGADVWGTADAFHYVYRTLEGDGTIVARVTGIQNVNNWTKAGVMIRNSASPSAAHAFMLVAASPAKGAPFQRRVADDGISVSTAGALVTAPRWVRLVRAGSTISAFDSVDGVAWTLVGSDTFTMGSSVLVGLAVSSHIRGVNASATFDNVTVTTTAPATTQSPLPSGWSGADVGITPVAGEATAANGVFTLRGSGADVWGTADAFHYAFTAIDGDKTIVARVTAVQGDVHAWVKAGVMIRESLHPGAAHAFMLASAGKGMAFQRRPAAGGASISTAGSFTVAPRWVKLQRAGNLFSAYESADGVTWTLVATETIPMGTRVFAGVAVTSHSTVAATCKFDSVTIQ